MAHVSWGEISVKKRNQEKPEEKFLSWVELCAPRKSSQIKGNQAQVKRINEWFTNVQCNIDENPCLFIQGPSGVWKSTAVLLCAKEHGYQVVHTQSDTPRTPQKLDAFLRKLDLIGTESVLLLDEFESFIKETTSLRWLVKLLKSPKRTLVVTVCNAVDKCFQQIRDMSTVVEFQPYTNGDMCGTLLRLSQLVSGFCHLPSMDCYFISSMSSGNVCQTVNQLQVMYYGIKPLGRIRNKKRKMGKVHNGVTHDSSVKVWSNTHKATSIDCFLKDDNLETISGMNRDFMVGLSENLTRDYIMYFHNSNSSTLDALSSLADEISASDCSLPEMEEDRLYETENADRWSEDNITTIGCICRGLDILKGREKNNLQPKRHQKKVFG